MQDNSVEQLLDKLKTRRDELGSRTSLTIAIDNEDRVRLKALSELYNIPEPELGAQLMGEILQQIEARIPYKAGSKVIRIEDGEPIYEDIGDMPRYLEIKRRHESSV